MSLKGSVEAPGLQPSYRRPSSFLLLIILVPVLLTLASYPAFFIGLAAVHALGHQQRATPLSLPVDDHVVQAWRDQIRAPCKTQPTSSQQACKLIGNIVASRRQLQDCGFDAVIVVPLPDLQSREDPSLGPTGPVTFSTLPYPVVVCTIKEGMPNFAEAFNSSSLDDPPCVRPELGRDDVAYTSFILQNYHHLPQHTFFLHGHECSWHQDSNTTYILQEFCGRELSSSMYVSLNNVVTRDWRRISCFAGLCSSAKKLRALELAWQKYFGYYLGPMPLDLTHFCCSQFLVSRSRVLLRPRQLYLNMLMFSLEEYPEIQESRPCHGRNCEMPGAVIESLWPVILGEGVPLLHDERLHVEYPPEQVLSTATLAHYRYAWSTDDWIQKPLKDWKQKPLKHGAGTNHTQLRRMAGPQAEHVPR